MSHALPSRTLSVVIERSPREVYDFVCAPENMSRWASGLGQSLRRVAGQWMVETPEGVTWLKFSDRNEYGVLDHWVYPANAPAVYVPMRVIANGNVAELLFTLFRQPDMSDEKFVADAEWVMRDLVALKSLLEEVGS